MKALLREIREEPLGTLVAGLCNGLAYLVTGLACLPFVGLVVALLWAYWLPLACLALLLLVTLLLTSGSP